MDGQDPTEDLLRAAANGNESAYMFLTYVLGLADFFDAVVDKDDDIPRAQAESAMWASMVLLPRNEFYRANFEALNPLMITTIQNWCVATDMERDHSPDKRPPHPDLTIAFIIRSSYADLITLTATITGGIEHGRDICQRAREFVHEEGFDEYLEALRREQTRRGT